MARAKKKQSAPPPAEVEPVLRLGNCLDIRRGMMSLHPRSVDHVITDPPYSEHVHANTMHGLPRGRRKIAERRSPGFAALTEGDMYAAAEGIAHIARRWVLVFCDAESVSSWSRALVYHGLEQVRVGAWVKICATPQFSGDRPSAGFEAIVICHARGTRKRWHGGGRPAIWHVPVVGGTQRRHHKTEKPVGLMEALTRDFSDRGEMICDPFAGSGSTGVAALRTGRRFVGWEEAGGDFAVAARRLKRAREQLDLWDVADRRHRPKAPVQKDLGLAL